MRLMGLKEEEVTELIEVNGNKIKEANKQEIDIVKLALQRDVMQYKSSVDNYQKTSDEEFYKINDSIRILLERISVLEKSKSDDIDLSTNETMDIENEDKEAKIITSPDDISNIHALCRSIAITGFNQTLVKYFLFENGIMNMNIHELRNTYSFKVQPDEYTNMELYNLIYRKKGSLIFRKGFITYCIDHKEEILKSVERYRIKQEQYKTSKKKIASKNIKNYQNEINEICGVSGNYDKEKWGAIYTIFKQDFPMLDEDVEKYRVSHPLDRYPITKVKYIVSVMEQGNYLLKIACDLFA